MSRVSENGLDASGKTHFRTLPDRCNEVFTYQLYSLYFHRDSALGGNEENPSQALQIGKGAVEVEITERADAAGLAEAAILGIDRLDVSLPVALGGLKDNQVLVVEVPQDVQGDVPTSSFEIAFDSGLGFQRAEIEGLDPYPDI